MVKFNCLNCGEPTISPWKKIPYAFWRVNSCDNCQAEIVLNFGINWLFVIVQAVLLLYLIYRLAFEVSLLEFFAIFIPAALALDYIRVLVVPLAPSSNNRKK